MLQPSNLSPLAGLTLLMSMALVSGCSSSDSDDPAPSPDGGDVIIDGPAPDTPAINATNARALAIESLELADVLVYAFSNAGTQLLDNASIPATCGASGSVSVSAATTAQVFELDNCQLGGEGPTITGQMSFDGLLNNGFAGTQSFTGLQIVTDTRTISIDGTAAVTTSPDNVAVSEGELVVNDSQSVVTLSQSTLSISNVGTTQQSVQMNLTADAPRFGLTGATIASNGLMGQAVTCPQAGTLTVDADANGSLLVTGATGSNLTFDVDATSDTLACSEVATIVQISNDDITSPPGAPGGL